MEPFQHMYSEEKLRVLKRDFLNWAANLIQNETLKDMKEIKLGADDLVQLLQSMNFLLKKDSQKSSNNLAKNGIKVEITCMSTKRNFVLIKQSLPDSNGTKNGKMQHMNKFTVPLETRFLINNLLHHATEIVKTNKRAIRQSTNNNWSFPTEHIYHQPFHYVNDWPNLQRHYSLEVLTSTNYYDQEKMEETFYNPYREAHEKVKPPKCGKFKWYSIIKSAHYNVSKPTSKSNNIESVKGDFNQIKTRKVVYPEEPGSLEFTNALSKSSPCLLNADSSATIKGRKSKCSSCKCVLPPFINPPIPKPISVNVLFRQ